MTIIKNFIEKAGWPRVIIGIFLLVLFLVTPLVKVSIIASLSDTLIRFGMNIIMVLALVPMIQSGVGLNFGLPIGVISGLLGATLSMQYKVTGLPGFLVAVLFSLPFSMILGYLYGSLLNRVKGDEMVIAIYVGFSFVALMNIMWLILPYTNSEMLLGFSGKGLRQTITTEGYWLHALSNIFAFKIDKLHHVIFNLSFAISSTFDKIDHIFYFPTGMFLFVSIITVIIWLFFKTKIGTAMTAVGSNPDFARASGINRNKIRLFSVILSTVLAGIGIIVYEQSFGFVQLYNSPFYMAFPAVAAILLGGASVNKASIYNVLIGTFLYQGVVTMTPSVINSMFQSDIAEVLRIIMSNGLILYALTRKMKARK